MDKSNYLKLVRGEFIRIVAMAVALFLVAGRLSYWPGWLFAGLSFWLPISTLLWSLKSPEMAGLLQERMKPAKPSDGGDKALVGALTLGYLGVLVVGALDGGRFQWTRALPTSVYLLGTIVSVLSASVLLWAIQVNRFFSTVVRIQADRGHEVCQGPTGSCGTRPIWHDPGCNVHAAGIGFPLGLFPRSRYDAGHPHPYRPRG